MTSNALFMLTHKIIIKNIIKGVAVFEGFALIISKFLTTTTLLEFLCILVLWTIVTVIFCVDS